MKNLDEAQGLTSEQLASWLLRHGWEKQPQYAFQLGGPNVLTGYQIQKQGAVIATGSPLHDAIAQLAELEKRNLQSLLREINPRMRKGMPSQAALRAHRGLWLRSLGKENIATVLSRQLEEFPSPRDAESFFWPCDENYNKVKWPTDAQGNML